MIILYFMSTNLNENHVKEIIGVCKIENIKV